jgi:predicted RNase H-like HicB family nuclease
MRYKVVLSKNEDGYTIHCPGLPGCWSQGATEEESLDNIRSAIAEYLAAVDELTAGQEVREVEVAIG